MPNVALALPIETSSVFSTASTLTFYATIERDTNPILIAKYNEVF